MYIGSLARHTGASPKAIRHFEALGLLGPVTRRGAYRVYDAATVERVRLIRQAQGLGARLVDLQALLQGAEPDWAGFAALVRARQATVQQELARLQAQAEELEQIHAELCACLDGRGAIACEPATSDSA